MLCLAERTLPVFMSTKRKEEKLRVETWIETWTNGFCVHHRAITTQVQNRFFPVSQILEGNSWDAQEGRLWPLWQDSHQSQASFAPGASASRVQSILQ